MAKDRRRAVPRTCGRREQGGTCVEHEAVELHPSSMRLFASINYFPLFFLLLYLFSLFSSFCYYLSSFGDRDGVRPSSESDAQLVRCF